MHWRHLHHVNGKIMSEQDEVVVSKDIMDMVGSPLSPASLADLFFRPSRFFLSTDWLQKVPELMLVVWISGIVYTIDRFDRSQIRAELGVRQGGLQSVFSWLTESWINYWLCVLVIGALNGWILWYLGGWWYRKRLDWAGAVDPSPEKARVVYMYQDLVSSGPALIYTLAQTIVYSSYLEAWNATELWSMTLLIFVLWSCVISYKAATSAFELSKSKARIWFLILPMLLYIVSLGLLIVLFAISGD